MYKDMIKKSVFILCVVIALLFTAIAVDGLYTALYASEKELQHYPWGSENGWQYHNKYNYMVMAVFTGILGWFPLALVFIVQHLTSSKTNMPAKLARTPHKTRRDLIPILWTVKTVNERGIPNGPNKETKL